MSDNPPPHPYIGSLSYSYESINILLRFEKSRFFSKDMYRDIEKVWKGWFQ